MAATFKELSTVRAGRGKGQYWQQAGAWRLVQQAELRVLPSFLARGIHEQDVSREYTVQLGSHWLLGGNREGGENVKDRRG